MRPGVRKFALSVHLSCAVGWIGAVIAYLALDLAVATSGDAQTIRAAWIGMGLVVWWVIVPLALASLVTGLVMSLGTKWGLIRHWWVVISLVLTTFATLVLLSQAAFIGRTADLAADPATSEAALMTFPNTLPHSIGGLLVLLVVQVLNLYKPQGLTAYGWRKQEEARQAYRRSTSDGQPSDAAGAV